MKLTDFEVGDSHPLFLIAGPCVIESLNHAMDVAGELKRLTDELGVSFVFKASYDKANRSSHTSYRGPGIEQGLEVLGQIRSQIECPVLTDVHTPEDVELAAKVVDVLQTPALLCRQTDLIEAAARSGKVVNIKKGQFLAPVEMENVAEKAKNAGGNDRIMLCERGTAFGYHNLVVDMRGLTQMRQIGCPVIFDATHSVQQPGAEGIRSGGQREYIPTLARAAVAAGVAGLFMETHPNPDKALSDGPNAWPLSKMKELLATLIDIDRVVKASGSEW